ncbi:DUF6636 domain-containing protein [Candidatus Solirubrobacter pratensis]|uniref:DUF6636 domain-containing protein n=1 Tax=Candidatus Solirubrobacter pratensis TaxID=1298857 RepID=UPI0004162A97|nr:DUF6636 domain-containing protein [Candidatus Solirubrobacter pratensis]
MIRPTAAALAAAVALAAVPATASAAYRAFRSPTGKLGCAFYSDAETPPAVRCEWSGGDDRAITLAETGKAKRVKITDTVMDSKARALAYGKTTTFRKLRCTSREAGISCRSTRSGHGFTVSVQKQEVY